MRPSTNRLGQHPLKVQMLGSNPTGCTIKLRQVSSNLLVSTSVKVLQLPLIYILLNGSVAQRQSVRLLTARSRYRNSPEPPWLDSVRVRRDFKISFPFEVQCGLGRRRGERLFEMWQRHLRKRQDNVERLWVDCEIHPETRVRVSQCLSRKLGQEIA